MNRRERTISPQRSHGRRLLPLISSHFNRTDNAKYRGGGDAVSVDRSGETNYRITHAQHQSSHRTIQHQSEETNRHQPSSLLTPLAKLIEKIELFPDDDDDGVIGEGRGTIATNDEDGSQGGRDSIFSATDDIDEKKDQIDIVNELACGVREFERGEISSHQVSRMLSLLFFLFRGKIIDCFVEA